MKINRLKTEIQSLHEKYHKLIEEDPQRFEKILRAEIPEAVCNANAIEGTTLTLKEVKSIILRGKVEKGAKIKEIYETRNLGEAAKAVFKNPGQSLSVPLILELHKKFLSGVNDAEAGKLRVDNRQAETSTEPGVNSEFVYALLVDLIKRYDNDSREFLGKIAFFHAELVNLKPFSEGTIQISQLIMDKQFLALGFPPIIIQNKNKKEYKLMLKKYAKNGDEKEFVEFLALALVEALRKYVALLEGKKTMLLSKWAKNNGISGNIATNKAKRQSIPAFRREGRWRIEKDYTPAPEAEPWGEFIATPV